MSVLRERKHLALLAVLLVAAIMEPLVAGADVIAWRLGDWHLQRLYFNYYSVTTLTSLGYSDITPVGTLTLSLSWLEVVFGQFYIAVVVAQLVGLRLAQSMKQV
jgi:hypothetical protein